MSLRWLEANVDDAISGLDAFVADMLKKVGKESRINTLRVLNNPHHGEKHRFNELKKRLGVHSNTLQRDLVILEELKCLTKTEDGAYVGTEFGNHVMGFVDELTQLTVKIP